MSHRLTAVVVGVLFALSLRASELFTNGGFETGDLTGWTVTSTPDSGDYFFADDTTITPDNGYPTVGPYSGSWYAVNDSTYLGVFPESTALTQTVTIPVGTTDVMFSADIFVNDVYGSLYGSSGLGGEIAIWANGANPLTATPLFVLYGPTDTFQSDPGTPNAYVPVSMDITADVIAGTAYEFGVLESDSTGPIDVGVDNFSLAATSVPEPAMLLPAGLLALGMLIFRARRRDRTTEGFERRSLV